jgi:hypothetical protein
VTARLHFEWVSFSRYLTVGEITHFHSWLSKGIIKCALAIDIPFMSEVPDPLIADMRRLSENEQESSRAPQKV